MWLGKEFVYFLINDFGILFETHSCLLLKLWNWHLIKTLDFNIRKDRFSVFWIINLVFYTNVGKPVLKHTDLYKLWKFFLFVFVLF